MIPKELVEIARDLKTPESKNIPFTIHFNMDPYWEKSVCGLRGRIAATGILKEVTCKNCMNTRKFQENKHKTRIWFDQ